MTECKHCKSTGKCDCYECKYRFAFNTIYGHYEEKAKKSDYYSTRHWREEQIKEAEEWARQNQQVVCCSKCNGAGIIKTEFSKGLEKGFEDEKA